MCVAPDYLLVSKQREAEILDALKQVNQTFYPDGALNSQIGHIVDEQHYQRLKKFLKETKGRIVFGGGTDDATRRIEPTVVTDVALDDVLMSE